MPMRVCIVVLPSRNSMTMEGALLKPKTQDVNFCQCYTNSPSGMFLNLFGDVEFNSGPSTDDLIQQLGVSLGTRLDAVTVEMQSMSSAVSTV